MATWRLADMIEGLQAAALDVDRWPRVLSDISNAIGGAGALLFSADRRLPEPVASPDLAATLVEYGRGGWHLQDERYRGVSVMERAGVMTDLDFQTPEQLRTSPFYQDFLGGHGLAWFAGVGFKAGHDLWCLSVQRSVAQGAFQSAEIELLKTLHRPLSDAATLSRQFDQARVVGMTDALEVVRHAALVCDARGRIVRMNSTAESLVGMMIRPREGTLAFRSARCEDAFLRMMGEALQPHRSASIIPLAVDVQDVQGNHLTMRALRIERVGPFLFADGAVMILIKRRQRAAANLLADIFKLTPAEVRVAEAVYAGRSVRDLAALHGVKEDTVRTQLKSIYAKTDTHRQSELVAFLGRIELVD